MEGRMKETKERKENMNGERKIGRKQGRIGRGEGRTGWMEGK